MIAQAFIFHFQNLNIFELWYGIPRKRMGLIVHLFQGKSLANKLGRFFVAEKMDLRIMI